MTTSEKAKAYDEVLERAKNLLTTSVAYDRFTIEKIFPELRESEDEKTRKNIIRILKGELGYTSKEDADKYIAWLEKQDKRDARYKYLEKLLEADTIYQMAMNDAMVEEAKTKAMEAISNMAIFDLLELENQSDNNNQNWKPSKEQIHALEFFVRSIGESGYASPYDDNTKLLKSLINDLYKLLENQSGQELADKAKPKFKVGDWILYTGDHYEGVRHITKIDENGYYIERNGLPHGIIPFDHEICMRLWTIQDAKDGDVLACGDKVTNCPFIFHNLTEELNPRSYCGVNLSSHFQDNDENGGFWCYSDEVRPATKEQCDLLFKKMKEAGYWWDAEKKKLNKINSYCQENCKGYQEIGKCFFDGGCDAKRKAEQESTTWSDEDEENLNKVIGVIERREMTSQVEQYKDILHKYTCWLKSLKDRVLPQPKTTWSSNDEYIAKELGSILYNAYGISDDEREMCNNWLNTIKSRVQTQPWQWSKEDEKIYQSIMDDTVQENQLNDKQTNWLRDIKYRYFQQSKQEWSEEDIRNIQDIDSVLFYDKDLPEETCMRLRNWLKSLKPNKEMIEVLRTEYEKGRADAINEMNPSWSEEDELNHKYALAACIYYGESKGYENTKDHQEALGWLKSLKERMGGK